MNGFLAALLLLAVAFAYSYLILAYRARAMRALANRLGWRFLGDQRPPGFSMRGTPSNQIKKRYNFIYGQKNGCEVVIFDSWLYGPRGCYSTFLAVRGESSIFETSTEPWKICRSGEWKALWRTRFWQLLPWTMSIEQIEEWLWRI